MLKNSYSTNYYLNFMHCILKCTTVTLLILNQTEENAIVLKNEAKSTKFMTTLVINLESFVTLLYFDINSRFPL